jgi:hypothetical protein
MIGLLASGIGLRAELSFVLSTRSMLIGPRWELRFADR